MKLELGVDTIEIERVKYTLQRFGMKFLQRFLLPSEILMVHKEREAFLLENIECLPSHIGLSVRPIFFLEESLIAYSEASSNIIESLSADCTWVNTSTLAGFWAIKEACSKAIGVGIGGALAFHDMCIFKDLYGKPHLALHETKYNHYNPKSIAISMSHNNNHVIAVCAICF